MATIYVKVHGQIFMVHMKREHFYKVEQTQIWTLWKELPRSELNPVKLPRFAAYHVAKGCQTYEKVGKVWKMYEKCMKDV